MRIAVFAPHFAEYAARMALALASGSEILLLLDESNRRNELQTSLSEALKGAVKLFEFRTHTRVSRRVAKLTVPLRILAFRPRIVHVQEQPDPLTAIVVAILRRFYPVVLTVHDPKPHTGRDEAFALRWDHFRQRIRRSASAYHVHGAYCAKTLVEAGVPNRPTICTLHGVILTPNDARHPGIPANRRILFFGRMEKYKGLDVLVAAISELNHRNVAVEFVLAGRGPELDRLMPTVSLMGNVTVLNRYLAPDEAAEQFAKAGIVVLPYREATQSGVVAAAFANGRPVVASRVGGLVDVVRDGENGLFVPPGSVTGLADALQRILDDDPLWSRLAEGARRTAASALSWAGIAETLLDGYKAAGA